MSSTTSPATTHKSETFSEHHAWKVLFGVSLVLGLFGIGDMLGGASDLQNGETIMMHSLTDMSWNELQAANPNAAHLIDSAIQNKRRHAGHAGGAERGNLHDGLPAWAALGLVCAMGAAHLDGLDRLFRLYCRQAPTLRYTRTCHLGVSLVCGMCDVSDVVLSQVLQEGVVHSVVTQFHRYVRLKPGRRQTKVSI